VVQTPAIYLSSGGKGLFFGVSVMRGGGGGAYNSEQATRSMLGDRKSKGERYPICFRVGGGGKRKTTTLGGRGKKGRGRRKRKSTLSDLGQGGKKKKNSHQPLTGGEKRSWGVTSTTSDL